MEYAILPTGACTNNCVVCCMEGELNFGFYHIGKTEDEKKGLENLFKSMGEGNLSITGGDPLRNPDFLELALKYHAGTKGILFNPLTFLCIESKKSADHVSKEEAETLISKIEKEGLSHESKSLISYLQGINQIGVSSGNLQCPNPDIMAAAKELYKRYVAPEIKKPSYYTSYQDVNGCYDSEGQLKDFGIAKCVGRLRHLIEKGRYKDVARKAEKMELKEYGCDGDEKIRLYFKKEDSKLNIYFMSCCAIGVTPYTSFKTRLTLDDMISLDPIVLNNAIRDEASRMKSTSLYRLLNEPIYEWIKNKFEIIGKDLNYDAGFKFYIRSAEELIKNKSRKEIGIIKNTYTSGSECRCCDVCNTTSLMLHRAGISAEEWQDYIEKKAQEGFFKKNNCTVNLSGGRLMQRRK